MKRISLSLIVLLFFASKSQAGPYLVGEIGLQRQVADMYSTALVTFLLERLAKRKAATATRVQRLRDFLVEVQRTPGLRHGFHAASFVV